MAHFAEIVDGKVVNVIVAEQEYVDTLSGTWVQTSYNTYGGVHKLGGTPLRKNYAGIGNTYDSVRDAFIPTKPYNSWVLNETTCRWVAPVDRPDDNKYYEWDEDNKKWVEEDGT
jgi:hypothetical protein|tara:strand:- start:63 stop:404 length:342 start_codon:yes stop_codon:yes gene_type:complete